MSLVHRVLPAEPVASVRDYQRAGGGLALDAARRIGPDTVIAEVEASGLRGRGGAGFPTGAKWRTIAANRSPGLPSTVVVNGAEGEPGTYKDRALLRADPYSVLEGALIAALAVEASGVVVALKPGEADRVAAAIEEMEQAALTGGVPVSVVTGPPEYLFGEETALLEVVEGRPPFPRIAPPYRHGVIESTALVDNVETLAHVTHIVGRGAAWFRELGTQDSPGTIVCTVTGDVRHPAVGEVAMGTTVRQAIEAIGGGAATRKPVKAVLTGVSAAPLAAALLDTPLTYEDMEAAGSGLGTASLTVLGQGTDMTAVAAGAARFLAVESCGQCTPCKADGLAIAQALEDLCRGDGGAEDLDVLAKALTTVGDNARCNLARQQQAVVGAIVDGWLDEIVRRAGRLDEPVEPMLVAEVMSLADGEVTVDEGRRTKQPDWSHGDDWSGAYPADSR